MHAALPLAPPVARPHGWPAPPAPDLSLLDDPQEWPAFGRRLDGAALGSGGRWESQVAVEGIHCAACAFTIEAALGAVPGVESVQVDAASRRARVIWSAEQVRPSQWFAASARAGYTLVPAADAGARERRRREGRRALWRWLVAGFCMMQVMMYAYPAYVAEPGDLSADAAALLRWASWVLTLPVMLFSCTPFFASAWREARHGRIGMDLPVALGMAITFAVSSAATFAPGGPLGEEVYFDSLTMFVFFLLTGRWLESRLRDRTAGALDALAHRMPESVERLGRDGRFERVAVRRLVPGDRLRVWPGECFPADGRIVAGATTADEALLTGESRPVARQPGEPVLAGSHNLSGTVEVRVERLGEETRFARIVALVERAALDKPRLARLADRVARPFMAAMLGCAALAAVVWWQIDPARAPMVAVAVLIVTCPCALSLATPAAMLASAGALARSGILVGRLQALEALAGIDTLVFDKTGTLTRPVPRLARVYCRDGLRPGDAVEMAAALGAQSLHPAARALVQAWQASFRAAPGWRLAQLTEHAGAGLEGRLRRSADAASPARRVCLGSAALCGVAPLSTAAMQVHLSDDDGWLASFVLQEDLRADAAAVVQRLRNDGLALQLLSGDAEPAARALAAEAGIAQVRGGCSPEDKLRVLAALQAGGHRVAMVGDGLNDAPVLAHADVSFAMDSAVPLARARADFVVLGDALAALPAALAQARRTLAVVRQNLAWAAGYNALCVPLAVAGWLPAWLAGLGMAASSLLVVANAARLARPAAEPR